MIASLVADEEKENDHEQKLEDCMRRASPGIALFLVLAGITTALYLQGRYNVHSQAQNAQKSLAPNAYIYYALKDTTRGFVLARAQKGTSGQPLTLPQPLLAFGNGFGVLESDSIATLQLSPDGLYLAIDGIRDHGEQVWVYDTQHMTMRLLPAAVLGNFLHWMPTGNGHTFLYRPMLPLGPGAPMDGGQWNPGLWLVDGATGGHTNIDISMPSADLIDAAPSPDGSRIIYSTTAGMGMGSDIWLMNSTGSQHVHVSSSVGGAQSVAGLFTWSPDGTHIAYERLTDSSTPFLPAGLWLMDSQGGQQRRLAETDGGHGYLPAWSPDSSKIAFVVRTNSSDRRADMLAQSLQCAIGVVDIASSHSWLVASSNTTGMQLNINPTWTADGNSITFTALNAPNLVLGGTPRYWSAQVSGPQAQPAVAPLTPALAHVVARS